MNVMIFLLASISGPVMLAEPAMLGSAAVDLVLGALLVFGVGKVLPLCIARVAIGGVVFTAMSAFGGDWTTTLVQVALTGAVLALLVGTPGVARLAAGTVVGALYLCLSLFGLYFAGRGQTPIDANTVMLERGEIQPIPEAEVRGNLFRYRFRAPSGDWFYRNAVKANADNPAVDRWLIHPKTNTQVMVIAEFVPRTTDVHRYEAAVLENARRASTEFKIFGASSQLWDHYEQSRFLHARAVIGGVALEYTYALMIYGDQGYQFIGFTTESNWVFLSREFSQMLDTVAIGE